MRVNQLDRDDIASTYGDENKGFSDDEGGLNRIRPLNMYGYSKQLFDLWALFLGFTIFSIFSLDKKVTTV